LKRKTLKRILVVSDLHVGSVYGIWPKGFTLKEGGEWRLNPAQEALLLAWEEMLKKIGKIDAVVLNGDIIDGMQCRNFGIPNVTTNYADQIEAAVQLLWPLRKKADEMWSIRGTEYHDSRSGVEVERLGKELDCVPYRRNQYSAAVLNLQIEGICLNFVHFISVMTGFYRATAPDREGIWGALSGRGKTPDAKVIVRSHIHYFVHVEHSVKHIVVTPCWQVHTEYQIRKGYYRMFPEIGAVVIEIQTKDEDPIRIRKYLWATPPELVHKYRGDRS
jgi:hypothetical protein